MEAHGRKESVPGSGKQLLKVDIIHCGAVPVRAGDICKGSSLFSTLRLFKAPLHPHLGQAGVRGEDGGGVLPHQIAVSAHQGGSGCHRLARSHVDHRPGVDNGAGARRQLYHRTGGQLQLIPPDHVPAAQVGAVTSAAPLLHPVPLVHLVQLLAGRLIGLDQLFVRRLGPLGHHGGDIGVIEIAQGDQAVPCAQGQRRPGQGRAGQHRRRRAHHMLSFHVSSSRSSRWVMR